MNILDNAAVKELGDLFSELVPIKGAAESVAGEIIRAAERIMYRWYNDGDMLGIGYGNETCNPAARYLEKMCEGTDVSAAVKALWGLGDDDMYEKGLAVLAESVLGYIKDRPELVKMKNTDDMWNYQKPEDTAYEDEDEEDDEWWDDEEEDSVWTGETVAVYDPD